MVPVLHVAVMVAVAITVPVTLRVSIPPLLLSACLLASLAIAYAVQGVLL